MPHSPTLSSTPRKSLDTVESTSDRYIETPRLNEATSNWLCTIEKCREETSDTVPKTAYLRLLDELEEVRCELDAIRREMGVNIESGVPVQPCMFDRYSK